VYVGRELDHLEELEDPAMNGDHLVTRGPEGVAAQGIAGLDLTDHHVQGAFSTGPGGEPSGFGSSSGYGRGHGDALGLRHPIGSGGAPGEGHLPGVDAHSGLDGIPFALLEQDVLQLEVRSKS
jgi:hypothetical protein